MIDIARRLILIPMFVGLALPAFSQITITSADVNVQFAVGNTLTRYTDGATTTAHIGSPGATSWDFSGIQPLEPVVLTSVSPASTPYISQFPGATHALRAPVTVSGISGTLYQYLMLGTNLLNPGSMAGATPLPGVTIILSSLNTPADILYALPSTFGTTFSSTFTNTEVITLSGQVISNIVTTHAARYAVDAYGPMTMPGSFTYDALRIRKIDLIDSTYVQSFIFLAKNGASVILTACDTSVTSGVIPLCGSITWSDRIVTSVRADEGIPGDFQLFQNYPNPFNPSTTIGYRVGEQSTVDLRIFDLLGREVTTLVSDVKDPGRYEVVWDATDIAGGVYLYRITAGSFSETRKLMLLR